MLPVIQIGPVGVQSSLLALLAALWVGASIAEHECRRSGLDAGEVWNVVGIGIAVTLVTARLVFAGQNWGAYGDDLLQLFSPTSSALSLDYGSILGLGVGYSYLQWRRISFPHMADALAPGALAAATIVSVGQFLSGDAFGTRTDLPWAVPLYGEPVHPVQLYDALGAFLGLMLVLRIAHRQTRAGFSALTAIVWYSATRVFIDAFRGDAAQLPGGYRVSQVIALAVLLLALYAIQSLVRQDARPENPTPQV